MGFRECWVKGAWEAVRIALQLNRGCPCGSRSSFESIGLISYAVQYILVDTSTDAIPSIGYYKETRGIYEYSYSYLK